VQTNSLLKVVNPLLFLVVLIQAATGLGLLFDRDAVREVHAIGGIIFIIIVATHIILNRRWFLSAYRRGA